MAKRDKKCYLCGEKYKFCGTCSQDYMKPAWMSEFHEENCKNIFDICTRFNMQLMSKTEAQDALNACDLSNKTNFKSYVIRDIEVIFAEEPKKKAKKVEYMAIEPKSHEVVIKKENE